MMNKMTLMTGATGFAGRHIYQQLCQEDWHITTVGRSLPDHFFPPPIAHINGHLEAPQTIAKAILDLKPPVVVHSAAMSKPNDCEVQQETAYALNTEATQQIAQACAVVGAKLVFMSTDFVFGDEGPYREDDKVCPVNYYGETKALAEKIVRQTLDNHIIIRTVLVYGTPFAGQAPTFLQWVANNLMQGKLLQIYTDQIRTPCYAPDLAGAIAMLLEKDAIGTFHVCGNETWTPFDMAMATAEFLQLNKELIQATTSELRPEAALRPANASLHIEKLQKLTGYVPTSLREALPVIFGK